jgi:hypothetical protein
MANSAADNARQNQHSTSPSLLDHLCHLCWIRIVAYCAPLDTPGRAAVHSASFPQSGSESCCWGRSQRTPAEPSDQTVASLSEEISAPRGPEHNPRLRAVLGVAAIRNYLLSFVIGLLLLWLLTGLGTNSIVKSTSTPACAPFEAVGINLRVAFTASSNYFPVLFAAR